MRVSQGAQPLSPKEIEAIGPVAAGRHLKDIAADLGMTEGAVGRRILAARGKLVTRTPRQAVAIAVARGVAAVP